MDGVYKHTQWERMRIKRSRTYVTQASVGWFLTEYLGVSKANIRKKLGVAGGIVTSEGGAKYQVAFPLLLHNVAWKEQA